MTLGEPAFNEKCSDFDWVLGRLWVEIVFIFLKKSKVEDEHSQANVNYKFTFSDGDDCENDPKVSNVTDTAVLSNVVV